MVLGAIMAGYDYKHTVSLFPMLHIILYCTYMNPPRMDSGWRAFPFLGDHSIEDPGLG